MILEHSLLTDRRTADIFSGLARTPRIIDVGCGIRPCPVFPCEEYVCIEPHHEYVGELSSWKPRAGARPTIIQAEAGELAKQSRKGSTVLLLDVIEHMEREKGEAIRDLLCEFEHAVVFTPLGWCEQGGENPDPWGYNGGHWQMHRSAWAPEDFNGWKTHVWETWHTRKKVGAILAVR